MFPNITQNLQLLYLNTSQLLLEMIQLFPKPNRIYLIDLIFLNRLIETTAQSVIQFYQEFDTIFC